MLTTRSNSALACLEWDVVEGVLVVRVNTPALRDEETIVRLFGQLDSLIGEHGCRVIVDLSLVDAFASYSIGKLLGLHKRLQTGGGRLALCGLAPVLRKLLSTMRLDRVLHLYEDEHEALRSF